MSHQSGRRAYGITQEDPKTGGVEIHLSPSISMWEAEDGSGVFVDVSPGNPVLKVEEIPALIHYLDVVFNRRTGISGLEATARFRN